MEAKQQVTKLPRDHWRHQGNQKLPRDKWPGKHDDPKSMGWSKSSSKREIYSKKQEKSQINNLTLHLKELEKEEQTKPKLSGRIDFIKIRSEINELEMKETKQRSIKLKAGSLRR